MRVLVAFESSGIVREAFRLRGHDAYSCDVLPSDGEHHICGDALDTIRTMQWDMVIAHPPCTALCVSGNATYASGKPRAGERVDAIAYVRDLATLLGKHSTRWAIENPVGVLSTAWKKPSQYIQPWQFSHDASKKTGLWLNELPNLIPTKIVKPGSNGRYANQTPSGQNRLGPSPDRWKIRSQTYHGIANAMADQWG